MKHHSIFCSKRKHYTSHQPTSHLALKGLYVYPIYFQLAMCVLTTSTPPKLNECHLKIQGPFLKGHKNHLNQSHQWFRGYWCLFSREELIEKISRRKPGALLSTHPLRFAQRLLRSQWPAVWEENKNRARLGVAVEIMALMISYISSACHVFRLICLSYVWI